MALTRAALREMGLTEKEIIDAIMDAHGETIETTKAKYQAKIDGLQEQLDAKLETKEAPVDGEDWKAKYEAVVAAHNETRASHEAEKTTAAKQAALKAALMADGANEKLIPLLMKSVDESKIELDGEKIKGWSDIVKPIKEQYGEVFGVITTQGAGVATPPKNNGGGNYAGKTIAELMELANKKPDEMDGIMSYVGSLNNKTTGGEKNGNDA